MRILLIAMLTALLAPAQAADRPATSAQLQDYVGHYTLNDGRTLSITQRRHRLVAQVDGQAAVTLAPFGPARFVDTGKQMELAFDQRPNGNVAGVTLALPAPSANE